MRFLACLSSAIEEGLEGKALATLPTGVLRAKAQIKFVCSADDRGERKKDWGS